MITLKENNNMVTAIGCLFLVCLFLALRCVYLSNLLGTYEKAFDKLYGEIIKLRGYSNSTTTPNFGVYPLREGAYYKTDKFVTIGPLTKFTMDDSILRVAPGVLVSKEKGIISLEGSSLGQFVSVECDADGNTFN